MLMPMISPGHLSFEVIGSVQSSGTSLVYPPGIAAGDIIVVHSSGGGTLGVPAAPAGFTYQISLSSGYGKCLVMTKEAVGDESGATLSGLLNNYIKNQFCFVLRPSRKIISIVAGPSAMNPVAPAAGNVAPLSVAPAYQGGFAIGIASFIAGDTGGDINWTRDPAAPDITIDAGTPGGPAWENSAWLFDQDPKTIVVDSPVNEQDYQTVFAGHLEFVA